jgi:hypothetical protein
MPRCAICGESVRPEDDFSRDEQGRFVHADCAED